MAARWTRRELCIRTAGAVVAAATAPFAEALAGPGITGAHAAPSGAAPDNAAPDNAARAADAYAAMQRHFYVDQQRLYRERTPQPAGDDSYAFFWTFEEAAKATLYMFGLPGGAPTYGPAIVDCMNGREQYWD